MATVEGFGEAQTAYQVYLKDHLLRMQHEIEQTTKKLELEKRRLNKLEEDVGRTRLEHEEKVLKVKVVDSKQHKVAAKKEARLAKAIKELNRLVHGNKEARDRIDQVRRERLQMNQVFKKLTQEIKQNQQNASQEQLAADGSRKERDESLHRLAALKKRRELERKDFKEGVQHLQAQLIETAREEKELEVRLFKETHNKTRGFITADEESNFDSQGLMRKILKLSFLNAIQRRKIHQDKKSIDVIDQAFATIKSTTGISDIDEIVNIFNKLEQKNYSLLTYVNTLNREIETIEKRNRELGDQINSQRRRDQDGEKHRKAVLSELKQQIASTVSSTQENTITAQQQNEVLEKCRPLIAAISKIVEKENRGFGGQSPAIDGEEINGDNVLPWLMYVEKTLMQWRDFLPEKQEARYKPLNKNYKYTVGNQVMALQPKKHTHNPAPLVKANDLPSAAGVLSETGGAPAGARGVNKAPEGDSDSDEDDLYDHPWTRNELRDKAIAAVAKRKKHRKAEVAPVAAGADQARAGDQAEDKPAPAVVEPKEKELGYDDMVEKASEADGESAESEDSQDDDDFGPTEEEINEIFLKRYNMSREELQSMADKMGIQLNNLCYLKQEFDAYDEDRSGYIDVRELKELLEKLGEELSEDELDQAFRELDSDGSGEIEFFEFVEWFTSED